MTARKHIVCALLICVSQNSRCTTQGLSGDNFNLHGKLIFHERPALWAWVQQKIWGETLAGSKPKLFNSLPRMSATPGLMIKEMLLEKYLEVIPGGFRPYATLRGYDSAVHSVAYSPDGTQLASGGHPTVGVWDVASRRLIGTLIGGHRDGVRSVSYRPDGAHLASGSLDGNVCVWDVSCLSTRCAGRLVHTLEGNEHDVHSVAYSPDGKQLACGGGDNNARIWDASSGQLLHRLQGHRGSVYLVAYSSDSTSLASGSKDSTVRIWNTGSGRQLASTDWLSAQRGWGILPQQICRVGENSTGIIRLEAVSPDGKQGASTKRDWPIFVWDLPSNKLVQKLRHEGTVHSLAFGPDGKQLAAGLDEGIAVWLDYKALLTEYFKSLSVEAHEDYAPLLLALLVAQAKQPDKPLYITELVHKTNRLLGGTPQNPMTSVQEWRDILTSMPPIVEAAFRRLFDLRTKRLES